jgi:hypothetical protein
LLFGRKQFCLIAAGADLEQKTPGTFCTQLLPRLTQEVHKESREKNSTTDVSKNLDYPTLFRESKTPKSASFKCGSGGSFDQSEAT